MSNYIITHLVSTPFFHFEDSPISNSKRFPPRAHPNGAKGIAGNAFFAEAVIQME